MIACEAIVPRTCRNCLTYRLISIAKERVAATHKSIAEFFGLGFGRLQGGRSGDYGGATPTRSERVIGWERPFALMLVALERLCRPSSIEVEIPPLEWSDVPDDIRSPPIAHVEHRAISALPMIQ